MPAVDDGRRHRKILWLVSYGCLLVAAALNRRVLGAQVVATGMALILAAVLSNGGRMPATPEAMEAAGLDFVVRHNSVASTDPDLPWLVDRFAAPEWVPWANVISVGDAVVALGSVVLVFAAMGAHVPGLRRPASLRASVRRPRVPRPRRNPAPTPAQIAIREPEDPAARHESAQVATLPARSARHASAPEGYARTRVEARGGPAGRPVPDGSAPTGGPASGRPTTRRKLGSA